jgi:hypothetical protein
VVLFAAHAAVEGEALLPFSLLLNRRRSCRRSDTNAQELELLQKVSV